MSKKTIIIIGGGIAGLSAACYGQMNGFRTSIFVRVAAERVMLSCKAITVMQGELETA